MLYEERSPRGHHTIDDSRDGTDIVGPPGPLPHRWGDYEGKGRYGGAPMLACPRTHPRDRDRLETVDVFSPVLDISNGNGPNRPALQAMAPLSR